MRKTAGVFRRLLYTGVMIMMSLVAACAFTSVSPVSKHDVVWRSPSADASGSMPIGNGRFGANVWVTPDGSLTMYLSHTDAWSEANRIIKLGKFTLQLDPPPDLSNFEQRLNLARGAIEIKAGDVQFKIEYDDDVDVMRIAGRASNRRVTAKYETWRTAERDLAADRAELGSSWTMSDAPADIPVIESADIEISTPHDVVWAHRNQHSIVDLTLRHQGLVNDRDVFVDPLIGRISGVRVASNDLQKLDARTLVSERELQEFQVNVSARCAQDGEPAAWLREVNTLRFDASNASQWERCWQDSFVNLSASADSAFAVEMEDVDRAYALARYMTRCASAGDFPIKFNGSIFTTEPKFVTGESFNPDYRRWGGDYWWQNTRLSYEPMLARGEWTQMDSLFRMYERAVPGCVARARLYYQADGVYFPETITSFGTYSNRDYGWDRTGRPVNDVNCPWWRWSWQQNLELCDLMLRRYEYSLDHEFLRERALPMVRQTMRYYSSRWLKNDSQRLSISPTQALETFWNDVVNDTPSIAGLHSVLNRVLAIQEIADDDRADWNRLKNALPAVPTIEREGVRVIAPAERYSPNQSNVENPELYAVHPFALYGVGRDNLELARATYSRRHHRNTVGWTQDGMVAAMLGLAEDAFANLLEKSRNSNEHYRFPAMWGPNFDWLPDQCHNGNITNVMQLMLIQESGGKIHVLPAWPKDRDVSFRLRASGDTIVECEYRSGAIRNLSVTPESRRSAIVIGLQ